MNGIELDADSRVNPLSLTIERDRFNKPVVLGELLGGDKFIVTLDSENKPRHVSGFGDTIFEDERSVRYEYDERIYTIIALKDVTDWLLDQEIPDFTGQPLVIDNFEYLTEHPIGKNEKSAVLEFTVNGWDSDVVLLTEDYKDVCGEDDANMLVFVNDLSEADQEIHRAVYREIAQGCRVYIKRNPYHRADSMISHFMRYGTKYAFNDYSPMIRYDIPVVTYRSIPKTEAERAANAIPARLVVNRKDTYWEACLFAGDDLYSKMSQQATSRNGGFGGEVSHEDFLLKVQTVYMFVGEVDFDFTIKNFDPIKLAS